MTISALGSIPPTSPINSVTPFTYRDNQTYLGLLEQLRSSVNVTIGYINDVSAHNSAEINSAIVALTAELNSVLAASLAGINTSLTTLETMEVTLGVLQDTAAQNQADANTAIGQLNTLLTEIDGDLANRYTKPEADALLVDKADASDLAALSTALPTTYEKIVERSATPPADTSKLWVDTSRTAFTPASAFVSLQTPASVPTGFSNGITVPFDFASHDDEGYWDSVNKKFVVQSAGRYRLSAQVSWAAESGGVVSGGRWVEIWSSRSGPRVYGSTSVNPSPGTATSNSQCVLPTFQYAAGTTFWVVARHTATTTPLSLGLNALTWFSIERTA
jgi:hypothetical protein